MRIKDSSTNKIFAFYGSFDCSNLELFYDMYFKPYSTLADAIRNAENVVRLLQVDYIIENQLKTSEFKLEKELQGLLLEIQKRYIVSNFLNTEYFYSLSFNNHEIRDLINNQLTQFDVESYSSAKHEAGIYDCGVFVLESELATLQKTMNMLMDTI